MRTIMPRMRASDTLVYGLLIERLRRTGQRRPSQGYEDCARPLQDAARALASASSIMRRMVRAQRPHWALQPRQP
ncbi:hypothetical protein BQ8482_110006 [Mesorhizobium delmotii]|uniref:Uncharacterized protein n=1 Tax=Mesorhizobium delmotii TaxID=1631247 RepID=A0A2P9AAE1_9HYPH|nr:hypothetical protein BQ8482_110006 [Mesorhizobium delmotii]